MPIPQNNNMVIHSGTPESYGKDSKLFRARISDGVSSLTCERAYFRICSLELICAQLGKFNFGSSSNVSFWIFSLSLPIIFVFLLLSSD